MPILGHFPGGGTDTSDATMAAADLLLGKTGYAQDQKITGTMPSKVGSGTILTPGTADIVIPQGYFGGASADGVVQGDAGLIASNIVSGISIFGVAGTASSVKTASGTGVATTVTNNFTASNGATIAMYSYIVANLTFNPRIIAIYQSGHGGFVFYWENVNFLNGYPTPILLFYSSAAQYRLSGAASVASGFCLPCAASGDTYSWIARGW